MKPSLSDGIPINSDIDVFNNRTVFIFTLAKRLFRFDYFQRLLCQISDELCEGHIVSKYIADLLCAEGRHPIEGIEIVVEIVSEFMRLPNEEFPVRPLSFKIELRQKHGSQMMPRSN